MQYIYISTSLLALITTKLVTILDKLNKISLIIGEMGQSIGLDLEMGLKLAMGLNKGLEIGIGISLDGSFEKV